MSWKVWAVLVLLLVGGGAAAGMWYARHRAAQQLTLKDLELAEQIQLRDSAHARLAVARAAKDSLEKALSSAKQLNGKLLAALALDVPERDTVIVRDTITTVADSGTRTASFRDSTFAGTLEGTVTAPPYPEPLGLRYTLTRPAFRPEIGLVQVADSLVATVSWQGENVRIGAPYASPRLLGDPTWNWYLVGLAGLNHYTGRIEGEFRISSRIRLLAEVSQDVRIGTHQHGPQIRAGVRIRP